METFGGVSISRHLKTYAERKTVKKNKITLIASSGLFTNFLWRFRNNFCCTFRKKNTSNHASYHKRTFIWTTRLTPKTVRKASFLPLRWPPCAFFFGPPKKTMMTRSLTLTATQEKPPNHTTCFCSFCSFLFKQPLGSWSTSQIFSLPTFIPKPQSQFEKKIPVVLWLLWIAALLFRQNTTFRSTVQRFGSRWSITAWVVCWSTRIVRALVPMTSL